MERRAAIGAVLLSLTVGTSEAAQPTGELYQCSDAPLVGDRSIGITVCDALATTTLTDRAEADNLQVRDGALVVELAPGDVSETAGLQPGDLIYRVGGVDVADARAATANFERIGVAGDTVVNFLRGGRPYRVKLRRLP